MLGGPQRFETTTDSDAASAAKPSRTNDVQPKSIEPGWKKISAEPASGDQGARDRAAVELLHPVRDREQQRQQRPDGHHDRAEPPGTSCSAQYRHP